MDMNIAGRGNVFPGSYKNIKISGRASAVGAFTCDELNVSGKFEGKSGVCNVVIKVSGSAYFESGLKAANADISGSLKCDKDVEITGNTSVLGSLSVASLKADNVSVRGSLKTEKDVTADKIDVNGLIYCEGNITANELKISIEGGAKLNIGALKCGKIHIAPEYLPKNMAHRHEAGIITIGDIEGDEIYLENVIANSVRGKKVTIGEGCEIKNIEME